ncbi:pentapeptide repeat-containing protein [Micromonospora tulbaghiae]|uniref:pentapeptide repeat-containing protein n=1 Tax=Micromonospora tulbaghiae TaxID=479978 RepID=UPI0033E548AF
MVNVLCSYLRMPFELPPFRDSIRDETAGLDLLTPSMKQKKTTRPGEKNSAERRQEFQVRLIAQEVLQRHWSKQASQQFWPNLAVNLAGATLLDLQMNGAAVSTLDLQGARLHGSANFYMAEILGPAIFTNCDIGFGTFVGTKFRGMARFDGALFRDFALFDTAEFVDPAFYRVHFESVIRLGGLPTLDSLSPDVPIFMDATARLTEDAVRELPAGWRIVPRNDGTQLGDIRSVSDENTEGQISTGSAGAEP